MRRFLKLSGLSAAAVLAAAAVYVVATLPPRAIKLSAPPPDGRLVWGGYHVHSNESDGSGTRDEIAAAAARAGLNFVIFTDHSDATRFDPPVYRGGVLSIHAAEISSADGHVVALGLDGASPYPLAGETRDVIEDIRRLRGSAIAAHPESPRQSLRWRAQVSGVDGFEWLNADSEWRTHSAGRLLGAGLRSLVRGPESIAELFRPLRSFERWDRGSSASTPFSLAALDAHARVGSDADGTASRVSIRLPSYESMFRSVAQAVALDTAMTGDAPTDSRLLLESIRARRSHTIVRAFADALVPVRLLVSANGASGEVPGVPDAQLRLLRNGSVVASAKGRLDVPSAMTPGVYRLEARIGGREFPWLVSDSVTIEPDSRPIPVPSPGAVQAKATDSVVVPPTAWQIEKDPTSVTTVTALTDSISMQYQLGGGQPAGQYVALAAAAGPDPIERIAFTGSARSPMRVSLQVRVAGGGGGQRWVRSIYLDPTARTVSVGLAELQPVDRRSSLRPIVARIQSVLIVVDTVNARPGASGELTIRDFRLARVAAPPRETAKRP